jgi:hypothetical protein
MSWLGSCRTGVRVIAVVLSAVPYTLTARYRLKAIDFAYKTLQANCAVAIVITITITNA